MLGIGYAFISAYLKGEEAKIITSSHVSDMSKVSDIQDALGVIKSLGIKGVNKVDKPQRNREKEKTCFLPTKSEICPE